MRSTLRRHCEERSNPVENTAERCGAKRHPPSAVIASQREERQRTQPDCVCDHCNFACTHAYPVGWDKDDRMWTLVEGTKHIYAQANPDGSLIHPPY